jgi:hemoglobin
MIRTPSAAAVRARARDGIAGQGLSGPAMIRCPVGMPFRRRTRGVSPEMDAAMPKKQSTAGKKARAAARAGEKYTTALRGQPAPGAGSGLEHRGFLDHAPDLRPFRDTGLFERIGGQPTVDRLVDLLYAGIDDDDQLRPLFGRDVTAAKPRQKLFFAEWLGGPRRYSEAAWTNLKHSHDGKPITRALAGRWLGHFNRALAAAVEADSDRLAISVQVRPLAMALVNRPAQQDVAWCGIGARAVTRATDLARRGDVTGLGAALEQAPGLLQPTYAAAIMQAAALAGRAAVVAMLLEGGVGPDHPFYLPVGVTGGAFERVIFVTPLCAARFKRRPAVEALLLAAGASEDVFTAAFLGDLGPLARMLAADPWLAQATDPAVDVLDITPVEHAVAGGQADALAIILGHVAHPLPGGVRALRGAAAQGSLAMAELLLAHGADASRIGVGRWVLHPELAPLLARRGAAIDSSGGWIGAACTGNQGRKDDPDYVRALLRHGARATDRRSGDYLKGPTGVRALDATALHYAAKAGFLRTIEVLLESGADPAARDSRGRTPLDWLDQAAPSVPRAVVRELLQRLQQRAAVAGRGRAGRRLVGGRRGRLVRGLCGLGRRLGGRLRGRLGRGGRPGRLDELLKARAVQAAECAVRAGPVEDGDLEVGGRQLRLRAVRRRGLRGRSGGRGGERGERGAQRLGERHAVGEALLERRRHLVGLAAEGDEPRLVGHRAVPGDAVDLVAVRLGADLRDHDLHLVRLARRLAEVLTERLRVPVRQAARGHVAPVELVAGQVRVGDAGLAQHLVLVVPADGGERDPVVDLADLVQHA